MYLTRTWKPADLLAKGILETTKLPKFKLSGLAIGNGWLDPFAQYPAYGTFAYDKKLIVKGSAVSHRNTDGRHPG